MGVQGLWPWKRVWPWKRGMAVKRCMSWSRGQWPPFVWSNRPPGFQRLLYCPAPATRNALSTWKSGPSTWCLNNFDFRIALAPQRGANFGDLNFQKCSEHASFSRCWLPNRSRAAAWCKFDLNFKKRPDTASFLRFWPESLSRQSVVQTWATSWEADPPHRLYYVVVSLSWFPTLFIKQLPYHKSWAIWAEPGMLVVLF